MSYDFNYPPAKVIQQLLIDLGIGSAPDSGDEWPIYVGVLPAQPDNCISVRDTEGKVNGREHIAGETQRHFGLQVRVRCSGLVQGFRKSKNIHKAFDENVNRTPVIVGTDLYLVQAVNNTGCVLPLGQNEPNRCWGFSLNALASVTIVQVGTGT